MEAIRVERTVEAPREALFDQLADHAGMGRLSPVHKAALLRPGRTDINGDGALRRVYIGPGAWVDEEISGFERPAAFEYLIVRSRPIPFRHEGGRVEFEELAPGRTQVLWTSSFRLALPVAAGPVARFLAGRLAGAFEQMIDDAAALATA